MFEHLTYPQVLVSGPHRSGTTIAARMIAADTGLQYIDEITFGVDDKPRFQRLLRKRSNIVVQCPCMAKRIHEFSDNHRLIVFMSRPIEDIQASAWNNSKARRRWNLSIDACLPCVEYEHWDAHKHLVKHKLDLSYDSLSDHPLWVPKRLRKGWKVRQWQP